MSANLIESDVIRTCKGCGKELTCRVMVSVHQDGKQDVRKYLSIQGGRKAYLSLGVHHQEIACDACANAAEATIAAHRISEQIRKQQQATEWAEAQARIAKEREARRASLWVEVYCKNGVTKRMEGIERACISGDFGHWVTFFGIDGTRLAAHCETYHTNLAKEDFEDGRDIMGIAYQ